MTSETKWNRHTFLQRHYSALQLQNSLEGLKPETDTDLWSQKYANERDCHGASSQLKDCDHTKNSRAPLPWVCLSLSVHPRRGWGSDPLTCSFLREKLSLRFLPQSMLCKWLFLLGIRMGIRCSTCPPTKQGVLPQTESSPHLDLISKITEMPGLIRGSLLNTQEGEKPPALWNRKHRSRQGFKCCVWHAPAAWP